MGALSKRAILLTLCSFLGGAATGITYGGASAVPHAAAPLPAYSYTSDESYKAGRQAMYDELYDALRSGEVTAIKDLYVFPAHGEIATELLRMNRSAMCPLCHDNAGVGQ